MTSAPATLDPGVGLTERMVTLPDGRRLRAVVAGERSGPLVVFEAGMSAPAACWVHVQREISCHAPTLAYDRAGYGGSDPDPADRSLDRMAADLTDLLDAVQGTAPVVLVGHSWGGPIIRAFSARHPERVAGLVLVDSSVAETMSPFAARATSASFRLVELLARCGATGLIERMTFSHGLSDAYTDDDRAVMIRDYASPRAMRAGRAEAAQILPSLPGLRDLQSAGTPEVPTVCLQGGRVDRGMGTIRPLMNDTAARLMARAPHGRVTVVAEAGHLIPQERPKPVCDAILDVLADAREARPTD